VFEYGIIDDHRELLQMLAEMEALVSDLIIVDSRIYGCKKVQGQSEAAV